MRIDEQEVKKANDLEREFKSVLNRYSCENGSNTPDFILAEYLLSCLESWNFAVTAREKWYGREAKAPFMEPEQKPTE